MKSSLLNAVRLELALARSHWIVPLAGYFLPTALFAVVVWLGPGDGQVRFDLASSLALSAAAAGWGLVPGVLHSRSKAKERDGKSAESGSGTARGLHSQILISGWLAVLPLYLLVAAAGLLFFGAHPFPDLAALLLLFSAGLLGFRSMGFTLGEAAGSVALGVRTASLFLIGQVVLSGSLFPIALLPGWLQRATQFLPLTQLVGSFHRVLILDAAFQPISPEVVAFLTSTLLVLWLAPGAAPATRPGHTRKLAAAVALTPFVCLGTFHNFTRERILENRAVYSHVRRTDNTLIENVRILVGDGTIIEQGAVLLEAGRIADVADQPDAISVTGRIKRIDGQGLTLLPGLVDTLCQPLDLGDNPSGGDFERTVANGLASQLYWGVTTVRMFNLPATVGAKMRDLAHQGSIPASELLVAAPTSGAGGFSEGSGFLGSPGASSVPSVDFSILQIPALPRKPYLAMAQVLANRAREQGIPSLALLETTAGLGPALELGMDEVVFPLHGKPLSREAVELMVAHSVRLILSLAWPTVQEQIAAGDLSALAGPMLEAVTSERTLERLRENLARERQNQGEVSKERFEFVDAARETLRIAVESGLTVIPCSQAGRPLLLPGAALHQELRLWVEAGIPAGTVIQTATFGAAQALGISDRAGLVRKGFEASLVLVHGRPDQDIGQLEKVVAVFLKGERVNREQLKRLN